LEERQFLGSSIEIVWHWEGAASKGIVARE